VLPVFSCRLSDIPLQTTDSHSSILHFLFCFGLLFCRFFRGILRLDGDHDRSAAPVETQNA
jgi:hypothetical protein